MAMLRLWSIKKDPSSVFVLLLMFCSFVVGLDVSVAETSISEKPNVPISIRSEKMTLKNLENKIIFEGKVFIEREGMTIRADRAEVLLSESKGESASVSEGANDGRGVRQITTSGNVRIVRGLQQAKADKGVYTRGKEVFVLTGNPEVWDKDFHVKGKVITFYIDEERTLVSESQAVIYNGKAGLSRKKK